MGWLDRVGAGTSPASAAEGSRADATPRERGSPGLAALFEGLPREGARSILDLGEPRPRHLQVLAGYARRIRFAGLVPKPSGCTDEAWARDLRSVPPDDVSPYGVVLAWDVLDCLQPRSRPPVMVRLGELAAPGARLYTVVDASEARERRPLRFALVDPGRVAQEVAGPPEPSGPPLLPAQVGRALAPFEIVHAFTLRGGLREYVAVKR